MKILVKLVILRFTFLITVLLLIPPGLQAQIQTYWIDTTANRHSNHAYFFTNRPVKIHSKEGTFTFKNKSTKQTDNLFFCLFDYEQDSIHIKYRAQNTSDTYPTDKVENNIFYKVYEDLRIKKGIKKFSFVVPGYSVLYWGSSEEVLLKEIETEKKRHYIILDPVSRICLCERGS